MAITNPEIPEMQIKAVLDAAAELIKEGKHPKPEIEIPLVIIAPEVKAILEIAVKVAAQVKKEQGFAVPYALGTMVETPAAAISGSEIVPALRAKVAGYDDDVHPVYGFASPRRCTSSPLRLSPRFRYKRRGLLSALGYQRICVLTKRVTRAAS